LLVLAGCAIAVTVGRVSELSGVPRNIVLIGFMGCGKSTVGRELRRMLGYPLVDTDSVIEARAGKRITRIFEEDGERAFRDMETELLRELAADRANPRIVATGGGIVVRPENRDLISSLGYVVWLRVPVETILRRTRRSRARPLLNTGDAASRVRMLLSEREPWYRQCAHLPIETAGLESDEVATGILESARFFFSTNDQPPCAPM
jgi:shikimate kinase